MQPESQRHRLPDRRNGLRTARTLGALLGFAIALCPLSSNAQVYRWVDDDGVTHLSTEKPPPGVKAERLEIQRSSPSKQSSANAASRSSTGSSRPAPASASPEQVAGREDLLGQLKTRECVIALEALERKTGGTEPTNATEIKRLKQTVEFNCSQDPARRRQQEEMAAKLRVANSPSCVEARNTLADLTAPASKASREQVKSQQAFVDEHCISPVR